MVMSEYFLPSDDSYSKMDGNDEVFSAIRSALTSKRMVKKQKRDGSLSCLQTRPKTVPFTQRKESAPYLILIFHSYRLYDKFGTSLHTIFDSCE